jgi:hypothetical protein
VVDPRKLIEQFAEKEKLLTQTEFLAPRVGGGSIKTSVDKIVYTFKPKPEDFRGWGIFRAVDRGEAKLVEEATLPQICEYLKLLQPLRLRLLYLLREQTWLAYPVNESDMQQRFGRVNPAVVHLVTEGTAFEVIIARCDRAWWFEDLDRRSDPEITNILNRQLQQEISPEELSFSGMTPEMATAYNLVWQQTAIARKKRQLKVAETRLETALKQADGKLESYRDRGEYWQIEWRTADGQLHSSAIDKRDLTVVSSGICLSGRDRDFDLQSLVGVMENRDFY